MKKKLNILLRLTIAIILIQTLFFKFTAAPESVFIFETLGVGAWGRIGSGVTELIAAVLTLLPQTYLLGAAMSLCIMLGALISHLMILGIEVQGDGGLLFTLASVVLLSSTTLLGLGLKEKRAIHDA